MDRQTIDKVIEILDGKLKNEKLELRYFKGCEAFVSTDEYVSIDEEHTIKVYAVVSYDTVVGFIDVATKTLYEYGKYTATTSCQITKILRDWYKGYERVLVKGVDTSKRFTKKPYGWRR